jgi:predicted nucleic acid-binding protein
MIIVSNTGPLIGLAKIDQLGLLPPLTGLAGLLLLAKKQNLVPAVTPLLQAARQSGYWVSDEILAVAQRLAGE